MNELHRQIYLSALGMDAYMPRWHLPYAPKSVACELPVAAIETSLVVKSEIQVESYAASIQMQPITKSSSADVSPVNNLISDIFETKKNTKVVTQPISAADILAQLNSKPVTVEPFSLSIWRPIDGVMIIDSRNTKFALPTELFLNNILRSVFSSHSIKLQEEVLRWPMIENSFTKRTANDARIELQTWLSVQHEIRPVRYLWLMGANAATYVLPEGADYFESIFGKVRLLESAVTAFIFPSLNELLQKSDTKKQLFSVLCDYHSAK